jgi:dolichol-phosphate mannosyltransferase
MSVSSPSYNLLRFSERSNEYCIVVFVINEGSRLASQLSKMTSYSDCVDVVVCDGGSSDGSTSQGILKKFSVTALLTKTGEGKLSTQMRIAFQWAVEEKYKGVLVIDGNDKDGPQAIPEFVKKLNEGYDFIQGSRFVPGGFEKNTPLTRKIAVKIIHAPLISLAAKFRYTDTTNGFRAYSSSLLTDYKIDIFRNIFNDYQLHYYLSIQAARQGYRCVEIPVSRTYPGAIPTPTKINPFYGNISVFYQLVQVCIGRYNSKYK